MSRSSFRSRVRPTGMDPDLSAFHASTRQGAARGKGTASTAHSPSSAYQRHWSEPAGSRRGGSASSFSSTSGRGGRSTLASDSRLDSDAYGTTRRAWEEGRGSSHGSVGGGKRDMAAGEYTSTFITSKGATAPEPSSAHRSDALRLLEQMTSTVRERMAKADETNRAIRAARESLDSEAVMARARAEAEAWTHGKSKLASLKAAQHMSPLGVRAVLAERDELRYQLRKAAQELAKVESNGALGHDMASVCQRDLERIASIKSQMAVELDGLHSRVRMLEESATEKSSGRRHLELQVSTLKEQLGESSETVLKLSEHVRNLEEELQRLRRESEERMQSALSEQRRRLTAQGDESRANALQRLESAMRAEKLRELDDLRQELDSRYADIVDRKLAEQRHALLAQANHEKVSELESLQSELTHQQDADLERMRRDLIADKDRAIQTLRRQHAAAVSRLEGELAQQQQELRAEQKRALDDLRHDLTIDFDNEKRASLSQLQAKLEDEHRAAMQELRQRIETQASNQAAANLQRELEQQRKKLQSQHKRQQQVAVNNLRKELEDKHKLEVKRIKASVTQRVEAEYDTKLKKEIEMQRRKASSTASRTQVQSTERLSAEHKRDKQEALAAQRDKLEMKYKAEIDQLQTQLLEARQMADRYKIQSHQTAEQLSQQEQSNKRSRQALKERLRAVLTTFKTAMLPRADALPDVHEGSPSPAMSAIMSLISCLGSNEYSRMDELSLEASAAPLHTVDVLLRCCDELTEGLNSAHRELQAMQQNMVRERKLVRKQVEEELKDEHAAELKALRVEMTREFDHELEQRVQAARQVYDQELNRNRRDMQHQLREYQAQTAAQQRQTSSVLREKLDREKETMVLRLQDHLETTKVDGRAKDALERKLSTFEKDLRQAEDVIFQLRSENEKLRTKVHELQANLHKTGSAGGHSSAEVHKLTLERRQLVKEKVALERQVALLRQRASA
ncbi:hypothetical protein PTSG_03620 [Salpingoeca rosetta]|uniref:Uncharacterized protein n=1 Tax=Salpingoeca rosetta (strain ATCC 50818 / BSB-021) TaxID=946362 RepID=F2U642_SALR5|nr:uncharacterized protein PTSG_03620 [Salpingoeca rosetta]EGD82983.1 hypothetical protein PTSG_03620 [Salpingoeca rosetta]|eukprot:XP_004995347.1 hypothetical protein PTSG_03620 [Salpingoeca rosetta]